MEKYNPKKIEKKWQNFWEKKQIFKTREDKAKKKYYVLDMFPYPSAVGLHVGHPEGYTATDIISRYRRMKYQENILHPMGFDAFGLPTENYAIKVNRHPKEITAENISNFKRQLKAFGFSYDWSRQINTSEPDYYKWTQWMFVQLYKMGLAYKKKAPVNWCSSCQTVLAREQVVDGCCERCKHKVIQKDLSQWFFKITKYADELLGGLDKIDWPEPIKEMQRNWIGRKQGINIRYKINLKNKKSLSQDNNSQDHYIEVFTTRPDTNFGATFITIAPDSVYVNQLKNYFANKKEIEKYITEANKKSELDRIAEGRKKTGVFTGLYAINQLTNKEMPIYISDFVLASVGTGAVVGVPGHDLRDFEFAEAMGLEVIRVVVGADGDTSPITRPEQVQEQEGTMINSGFLDGLDIHTATEKIMDYLEQKGWGKRAVSYKLRDWLVSRQRYWGAPIPIIYCEKCGEVLVPESDLPVELPDDVDFRPTGESPLVNSKKFHQVKCPQCGATNGVRREVDTMDTFVCSSWYHLRYCDPHNTNKPFNKEKVNQWMPVDLYVGGAEHAVMHLLYARFFTKALRDAGYIDFDEPYLKLRNQGMILAEDGRKMSKSLGNVINPDQVINQYGADTFRLYEMFMGPLEDTKPWDTKSIVGIRRFLEKVWRLQDIVGAGLAPARNRATARVAPTKQTERLIHQTIKKVTEDVEVMKFNTAISQMMILVNELEKQEQLSISNYQLEIILLSPFAPHICEELWQRLGHKKSILFEPWPEYDPELIKPDEVELVVQINGKVRDKISAAADISEADGKKLALDSVKVQKWLEGKKPKKIIFIKGKLVSIVI